MQWFAGGVVVGGANSAGQAAVFLAEHVEQVWLLIRGDDLSKSLSRYLIRRIEQMDNIELLCNGVSTVSGKVLGKSITGHAVVELVGDWK